MKKTTNLHFSKLIRSVTMFLLVLLYGSTNVVFAISAEQIQTMNQGILYFNVDATSSSCAGGSGALIGGDNPTKTWNYFKGQGLDDMHVAAIMGNIEQESHYNPTVMQKGGNSNNPADAGTGGWGIVQWTPGSKVINTASKYNIATPIYELGTQLNIVWQEMNDVSPAGAQKMIAAFKNTSTLEEATSYFTKNYEAAGIVGPRLAFAQAELSRYQGTGANSTSTATGASCNYLPPDCTSASGSAKILCAAKAYDPVSYLEAVAGGHQGGAAWHATCPTIDASCSLDCSGLVDIAVYDAFGVDLKENVLSMYNDTRNWQQVQFNQIMPGDLVLPTGTSHVEIIDHVQGTTIYTFGSHNGSLPQPDQVGPASMQYQSSFTFLHYIGNGSAQ